MRNQKGSALRRWTVRLLKVLLARLLETYH